MRFGNHYLFRHLSNFRCGEPVGESERNRPFPFPFLFKSILACARISKMNGCVVWSSGCSLLSSRILFFACSLPFIFSSVRSSYFRSVLVTISRFEMRILDFLLEMSLGHQLSSATIVFLVVKRRFLSVYLAISIFNSSEFSTCILYRLSTFCQQVCQRLLMILRPTLCRRLERCRSLIELFENI